MSEKIGSDFMLAIARGIIASTPEAEIAADLAAKRITQKMADALREDLRALEEARRMAEKIGDSIKDELEAQRRKVMDAAEALVAAAADRLGSAWSAISDRFAMEDAEEAVSDRERAVAEAQAKLDANRDLAGAGGRAQVTEARQALAEARAGGDEREIRDAQKALDDLQASIAKAREGIPGLEEGLSDAERDLQRANFRLFQQMLDAGRKIYGPENVDVRAVAAAAGLSQAEIREISRARIEQENARNAATAAQGGAPTAKAIGDAVARAIGAAAGPNVTVNSLVPDGAARQALIAELERWWRERGMGS